jgi:hypothetical protein
MNKLKINHYKRLCIIEREREKCKENLNNIKLNEVEQILIKHF